MYSQTFVDRLTELRKTKTPKQIARLLNGSGQTTFRGKKFTSSNVYNILSRFGKDGAADSPMTVVIPKEPVWKTIVNLDGLTDSERISILKQLSI